MSKHPIVHIEIAAQDPNAAGVFYGELFGWKIAEYDKFDYVVFDPEEGPGGGFPTPDELFKIDRPMIYVQSEDIESDLEKVEHLGGSIVRPKTEIPETGWYAVFTDPSGNHLALYTNMNP